MFKEILWTRLCTHEYLSCPDAIIQHTQLRVCISHSGIDVHSFKHSFNMFNIIINRNIVAEVKMCKTTYLMETSLRNQLRRCNVPPNHRPACSLISQQRCHPELGMILQGIREQAGLHIAKDTQNTAKPTQLGLSRHQQDSQANMVRFIRPSRSWERLNAKLVSSLQSQEHVH